MKLANSLKPLSALAVPLGFNTPSNGWPLPIVCLSDVTRVEVRFFEYHNLHWFSGIVNGKAMNSPAYFSVRACVSSFRAFVHVYKLRFEDSEVAELRLKGLFRSSSKKSSEV